MSDADAPDSNPNRQSQPAAATPGSRPIPVAAELDTSGLSCPEPLMLVRHRMRELTPGAVLHVRATDPSTERDFQNYCRFVGHTLVASERTDDGFEFWLQHTA